LTPTLRIGLGAGALPTRPEMFNQPLSDPGGTAGGKDSGANTLVEHSAVVSSYSRNGGGLPSTSTKQAGPSDPSSRAGVYNVPRSSTIDCMVHLMNSFTSQGLSG